MKSVTGLATLNEQSIVALPVLEDRVTTTRPSPLQAAPDGSATFRKGLAMRIIQLTNEMITLIDDADYNWLSKYTWWAFPGYNTYYAQGYVNGHKIFMHRLILGLKDSKIIVDHKNHNGFDNQRSNLRLSSHAQNMRNQQHQSQSRYPFKGVFKSKRTKLGHYCAQITIDYENRYLGTFNSIEEAHAAYCEAAKRLHGEFACFE